MWTLHVMAGGSSNNKIATVTSTGKITAKKAGTCKIYVKGNGITKVVTVTVKNDSRICKPRISKIKY